MLITKDFIFVHIPKTGGSFINKVVLDIYSPQNKMEKILDIIGLAPWCDHYISNEQYENLNGYQYGQHCGLRHIDYNNVPVFHVKRDPVSYYQSLFFFGWYKKYPHLEESVLKASFKNFPNLQPEEVFNYYQLLTEKMVGKEDLSYGHLTFQLVDQLSPSLSIRNMIFKLLDEGKVDQSIALLWESVPRMHILELSDLNHQLIQFLHEHTPFTVKKLERIHKYEMVNVSDKDHHANMELSDHQRELEKFVYKYWGYINN